MTSTTHSPTAPATLPAGRTRRRRYAEAGAFVAVWVTAGCLLPLSSNGYLLLGIPLTVAFQLLVRRRPPRELFAVGPDRFTLDRRGAALAVMLAIVPGWFAIQSLAHDDWATTGWYVAATAGAACAAFALRAGTVRAAVRFAVLPVSVGAGGFSVVYGLLHILSRTPLPLEAALTALPTYVLLYFPATFLLEEVSFRAALDAHVHPDGESPGWQSAAVVSALWGVWHLPVSHGLPFPLHLTELVLVHVVLGVPLSMAWRRTRNLAAPALAHAVNDAVRNSVMIGL